MLFKLQLFLQIDFHQEHFITEVLFNFYFIPNMIMQCLKSLDLFVFLTFVHTILISWNPNLYLMSFWAMLPITRSFGALTLLHKKCMLLLMCFSISWNILIVNLVLIVHCLNQLLTHYHNMLHHVMCFWLQTLVLFLILVTLLYLL